MKSSQWNNNSSRYGLLAVGLHWLSAICFIGLFALGFWMVELGYYDAWYQTGPHLHESVGLIMVVITGVRLLYKFCMSSPQGIGHGIERFLAKLGHAVLYALIVLLLVSGYLISAADAEPIMVFNWFGIPSLWVLSAEQLDWVGAIHRWVSYGFIAVVVCHGVIALVHHWVKKDQTLIRMAWPFLFTKRKTDEN